jgi:glycosyltransferase involved in cell wall biosynthesis
MRPFLSVVTRCHRRPAALYNNIASLARQTNTDYQHLFIVDDDGMGIEWANRQLGEHAFRCDGDYVMVLDDDDMMTADHAIDTLIAVTHDDPQMVVFKCDHGEAGGGILPDAQVWQRDPVQGRIGMCSWIVHRDVWLNHAPDWKESTEGDYHWLMSVWDRTPRKTWLDLVLTKCQNGRSYGATE